MGEENQQFRQWGYFNYLVYSLVSQAAGREPLSFADYPASPVPHPGERLFLYLCMAALLASSGVIFWLVRRYSLAHPEALDTLVRDRQAFAAREAGTDWEQIGFHRPLGGFMFALMTGIFLFIPLTVYQDFILPVYILPSAQAMGIYGRVAAFFPIIWGLFDMGTSVAHMKFFSEYRVRNPRRAIQYAQFFVWWQALTGAVQVAMVVAVAGTLMPQSAYALYTWAVITHAFIQIPGFFRLFTDAFSGIQRSDYGTILDMGINMVFPMVAQPIVVSLLVWWGWNNPVFGPSMGGVVGLGVAAYATELMSFAFGWYLYRRLGYNSRLLMMAHFDKVVALDSLKYGLFLFLSSLIGGLGTSINVLVIQNRLHNNNEILGNLGLAGSFVFAFSVFQSLTGAMMPSISEAVSNGRKILAQYYATNGYKYGGMVSGYIGAIMLAVADRFILGSSGQSFERAASLRGPHAPFRGDELCLLERRCDPVRRRQDPHHHHPHPGGPGSGDFSGSPPGRPLPGIRAAGGALHHRAAAYPAGVCAQSPLLLSAAFLLLAVRGRAAAGRGRPFRRRPPGQRSNLAAG